MPEPTVADVQQYTGGRIDKTAPETAQLLERGLAAVRRYCGWHVAPATTDAVTLTIDGPGGRLLRLPTLRLIVDDDFAITEEGVELDVADLYVSERGMVTKKSGAFWSHKFGAITVTMNHGYDDAPDFFAAALSVIDRMSLAPTGGRANVIGPFQYPVDAIAAGTPFTAAEKALLDLYRLEPL